MTLTRLYFGDKLLTKKERKMMEAARQYFAVIDTETNWYDQVMSIGVVISEGETYTVVDSRYYVLFPEYRVGGMYSSALLPDNNDVIVNSRANVLEDLFALLKSYNVSNVFAYNAYFDYNHLPELSDFVWRDIMKLAAYRQYNGKIPSNADCYSTGRLKRNYGVESMLKLMLHSGYRESHNALNDAVDELIIMKLLNRELDDYPEIKSKFSERKSAMQ